MNEKQVIYGIGVLAALKMGIIGVATYLNFNSVVARSEQIDHTHQLIATSEKVLSLLKDAETGQRGYLLSGNSAYLEPYLTGIDSSRAYIDSLQALTRHNVPQQARLDSLRVLTQAHFNLLDQTIQLKNTGNTEALGQIYQSNAGKQVMDRIRALTDRTISNEKQVLSIRQRQLDTSVQWANTAIYLAIITYIITFLLALAVIIRLLRKRERDQRELHALNEEIGRTNEELAASNEELAASSEELLTYNDQLSQMKDELEIRVEERTRRLDQLNSELLTEIAERKRTEEALKNTLDELKQRNHELDHYVYKVSHDLRSPLVSILGLVNLIRQEPQMDTVQQYAGLIENRVAKSDEFIKSILTHSKTLNSEVRPTLIHFCAIIQECIDEFRYLPDSAALDIQADIRDDVPFYGDALRVGILFRNFISNAIKYRNPRRTDSYCHITVETTERQAIIRIEDNGIGIAEPHLNQIFAMFYRATDRSNGSGLGLYIVKQSIERLGGTVTVDSHIGEGSTFCITLANMQNAAELTTHPQKSAGA